jgi:hypothetical protein
MKISGLASPSLGFAAICGCSSLRLGRWRDLWARRRRREIQQREESGGGDGGVEPSVEHVDLPWLEITFHDGGRERRVGAGMLWRRTGANLRVWRRGRRERERERERTTAGRTVHQNVCTSTLSSYRVVEI